MSEKDTLQRALHAIEQAFKVETQAQLDEIIGAELAALGLPYFMAGEIVELAAQIVSAALFRAQQSGLERALFRASPSPA